MPNDEMSVRNQRTFIGRNDRLNDGLLFKSFLFITLLEESINNTMGFSNLPTSPTSVQQKQVTACSLSLASTVLSV